jgi:hypothetical protein
VATASYKEALDLAVSLSREDQLRLIEELTANAAKEEYSGPRTSILELQRLGKEIWEGIDAQEYVRQERASWNG